METKLPTFEGRGVEASAIRLTGKADERVGALSMDEEVFLLVRAKVAGVSHQDAKIGGAELFARVHKLTASTVVVLPPGDGERMIDEAAMLADERFGIRSLFNPGGGPDGETGEIGD